MVIDMKKRVLSILLVALLIVGIVPANVFAATTKYERPLTFETNIATELKKLNLFKGVSDTNFALEKVPSRLEALVIMLRLMGKENEILAGSYSHPFTDVPSWADKYVGYAYENGLTKGSSATKFGTGNATDVQFLTFVLRALGYSDSDGDFTWDNPYDLAEELGVINDCVVTGSGFLRADCVIICYNSLSVQLKNEKGILSEKLIADGVFAEDIYNAVVDDVDEIISKQQIMSGSTINYSEISKIYFGRDIELYNNPKTDEEYTNNFLYSFVRGDFEYSYLLRNQIKAQYILENEMHGFPLPNLLLTHMYETALGYFLNEQANLIYFKDNKWYINLGPNITLSESPSDIKYQLIAAYNAAVEIHDDLHANGIIRVGMNELNIAKAYTNYLKNNSGIQTADGRGNHKMIYDSAYGALVNKNAACGGRAAATVMLLRLEGIKSSVLYGRDISGQGHLVPYAVLDGKEYGIEWKNLSLETAIQPISNVYALNGYMPHTDSLELARTECGYTGVKEFPSITPVEKPILEEYDLGDVECSVECLGQSCGYEIYRLSCSEEYANTRRGTLISMNIYGGNNLMRNNPQIDIWDFTVGTYLFIDANTIRIIRSHGETGKLVLNITKK